MLIGPAIGIDKKNPARRPATEIFIILSNTKLSYFSVVIIE